MAPTRPKSGQRVTWVLLAPHSPGARAGMRKQHQSLPPCTRPPLVTPGDMAQGKKAWKKQWDNLLLPYGSTPGVPPPWPHATSPLAGVIWGGLSHICPRGWGQRGGHVPNGPAHLQVLKLLLLLLEHLELLQHRVLLKLPPVHLGKDAGGCQRPQEPSVPLLSPHHEAAWPHAVGGEPHTCHRPHGTETWMATTRIKGLARGHSSGAVAEGSGAGWLPKSRGYTLGFFPPL